MKFFGTEEFADYGEGNPLCCDVCWIAAAKALCF